MTACAFYRFIGQNIRKNLYGDDVWRELFSCRSKEEQQAFADKYLLTEAWHTAVKMPDTLQNSRPGLKGIEAFFLSNVFDLANEKDWEEICSAILLAKSERSLVLFRNMLSRHPLPAAFRKRLQEDKERALVLLDLERSGAIRSICDSGETMNRSGAGK